MANPHKGEVAFEADGATYTLCFSIDALCSLEEATGKGIIAISNELSDADRLSLSMIRNVLWAGLQAHHPKIDLKKAGELIISAGGLPTMIGVISKAFAQAFPEPESDAAARPPIAGQNGTGPRSTVRGVA